MGCNKSKFANLPEVEKPRPKDTITRADAIETKEKIVSKSKTDIIVHTFQKVGNTILE